MAHSLVDNKSQELARLEKEFDRLKEELDRLKRLEREQIGLEQIEALLGEVVKNVFEDGSVQIHDIRPEEDHDGDPILRIKLLVDDGAKYPHGSLAINLLSQARSKLFDIGEFRFPFFDFIRKSAFNSDEESARVG